MGRDDAFRERAAEFASRAFIGILYAQLSVRLFGDFIRTQHLTALLLLVSESLVVVFTIFRRRAQTVDRSFSTRLVTAIAVVGPALLHPIDNRGLVPDPVTAVFVALGAFVVIAAKMTLGRSFGIAPANRGIVATGPYSLVRHPIYAGYLVTHVAFLAAHPSLWNFVILTFSDACLIIRTSLEERILSKDTDYRLYCKRVGWRLLPGVY
jgi:protein-S-isoprenylcysteine O-methyltransferase Ste14